MTDRNELEQQIWEFIYDLLPEAETQKLLAQIRSDPDVARKYSEIKTLTEMLGRSAKVETPSIDFHSLADQSTRGSQVAGFSPDQVMSESIQTGNDLSDLWQTVDLDDATRQQLAKAKRRPVSTYTYPASPNVSRAVQVESSRVRIVRLASWVAGVAALLLVAINMRSYSTLRTASRSVPPASAPTTFSAAKESSAANTATDALPSIAAKSQGQPTAGSALTLATVVAPSQLDSGANNSLFVSTTSLDGEPRPTSFQCALYDAADNAIYRETLKTDASGTRWLQLPRREYTTPVKLVVVPNQDDREAVETRLDIKPTRYVTHIESDRHLYRPGESIQFRTVTLTQTDFQDKSNVEVAVELRNPNGESVANTTQRFLTQRGVAHGHFDLPLPAVSGKYAIVASSPQGEFSEVTRHVTIADDVVPSLSTKLEFGRSSYAAGDEVSVHVRAIRADQVPAAAAKVRVRAHDNRVTYFEGEQTTTDDGGAIIGFSLPKDQVGVSPIVSVTVEDGDRVGVVAKPIPLRTGAVAVDFFPEGGELVAEVPNHVYFFSHDGSNKPVHVAGEIVAADQTVVANFETKYRGMGVFAWTPQANVEYSVRVHEPAQNTSFARLPPIVTTKGRIVLHTDPSSFTSSSTESASILPVLVQSNGDVTNVALVATCRETEVGQSLVRLGIEASSVTVDLNLTDEASGVLRLTAYDASRTPPAPIAERLVFRDPARSLQVQLSEMPDPKDREMTKIQVDVADESGRPVNAMLGLSIVDELMIEREDEPSRNMLTRFLLTGNLPSTAQLESADFYLSNDPRAQTALDLLLGTVGWRSIRPSVGLAANDLELSKSTDEFGSQTMRDERALSEVATADSNFSFPIIVDNRDRVTSISAWNDDFARISDSPRPTLATSGPSTQVSRTLAAVTLWVGVAFIVIALAMAIGIERARWRSVAPAIVGGVLCIGAAILLTPSVLPVSMPRDVFKSIAETGGEEMASRQVASAPAPPGPVPASKVNSPDVNDLTADDNRNSVMEMSRPLSTQMGSGKDDLSDNLRFSQKVSETETLTRKAKEREEKPAAAAEGGRQAGTEVRGVDNQPNSADKVPAIERSKAKVVADAVTDPAPLQSLNAKKPNATRGVVQMPAGAAGTPAPKAGEPRKDEPPPDAAPPREVAPSSQAPPKPQEMRSIAPPSPSPSRKVADDKVDRPAPAASELQGREKKSLQFEYKTEKAEEEKLRDLSRSRATVFYRSYSRFALLPRSDYRPTLLWEPTLAADENGHAEAYFKAPSTPRVYRIEANAHGSSRLGTSIRRLHSSAPLQVAVDAPRVITNGDTFDLPVSIENHTREAIEARVTMYSSARWEYQSRSNEEVRTLRESLAKKAATPETLTWSQAVPADQRGVTVQSITAFDGPTQTEFHFDVSSDRFQTAVTVPIAVRLPSPTVSTFVDGEANGSSDVELSLPREWDESGSIELRIYPSLEAEVNELISDLRRGNPTGSRWDRKRLDELAAEVDVRCKKQQIAAPELLAAISEAQVAPITTSRSADWLLASSTDQLRRLDPRESDNLTSFRFRTRSFGGSTPFDDSAAFGGGAAGVLARGGQKWRRDNGINSLGFSESEPLSEAPSSGVHLGRDSGFEYQVENALKRSRRVTDGYSRHELITRLGEWKALEKKDVGKTAATNATVRISINGKSAAEASFDSDASSPVVATIPAGLAQPGRNDVTLNVTGAKSVKFSIESSLPFERVASHDLSIATETSDSTIRVGEILPYSVKLSNLSGKQISRVVAVLPIAAGLMPVREEWDQLLATRQIDSYELREGEILVGWELLDAGRKDERAVQLHVSLVAKFSGKFIFPSATVSYLDSRSRVHAIAQPMGVTVNQP